MCRCAGASRRNLRDERINANGGRMGSAAAFTAPLIMWGDLPIQRQFGPLTLTVFELGRGKHHRRSGRTVKAGVMHKLIKRADAQLAAWISDQELAVIIGIIVLIFVSWGILPFVAR